MILSTDHSLNGCALVARSRSKTYDRSSAPAQKHSGVQLYQQVETRWNVTVPLAIGRKGGAAQDGNAACSGRLQHLPSIRVEYRKWPRTAKSRDNNLINRTLRRRNAVDFVSPEALRRFLSSKQTAPLPYLPPARLVVAPPLARTLVLLPEIWVKQSPKRPERPNEPPGETTSLSPCQQTISAKLSPAGVSP